MQAVDSVEVGLLGVGEHLGCVGQEVLAEWRFIVVGEAGGW